MTDNKGINPRTYNALAAGAFLLAVAFAIVLFWSTGDLITSFGALLLVFGAYIAGSSLMRDRKADLGPSDADAALAGGIIIAGVGATCIVWAFSNDVMITSVVFIVIIAIIGILMAIKNRNE